MWESPIRNDQNILRRIKNSLAAGLDKEVKLPKFIVMILDSDIFEFIDFDGYGISSMIGDMLESLIKDLIEMIDDHKSKLPTKCKKEDYPFFYWIALPHHKNFNNNIRSKFNSTLDTIVKLYSEMRIALIKEHWDFDDDNLVSRNNLTRRGTYQYWKAIDASLKFNIGKRSRILGKQNQKRTGKNSPVTG